MRAPHRSDRRVVRTRATLRDALVALIMERGWDSIAIQDVCERANVGRSTFYTHFADKEDLLLDGFEGLRVALQQARPSDGSAGRMAFTLPLLEHADEHRRLFRALVDKRSSLSVQRRFLQLVMELAREDLAGIAKGDALDALATYLSGAFFQLVVAWLDSRRPLAPQELNATFQRLTKPVLESVRSQPTERSPRRRAESE
jgi:AcrR family transcriptional regulator